MSPVKSFFQRWLVTAAGVLVASQLVSGIDYTGFAGLLTASLLLGVFNAILRPIMLLLSLPLLIVTLGLFAFVVNAFMLLLVGNIVKGFYVAGFWSAFWGGIIISLVSLFANGLIGRPAQGPPSPGSGPGPGPRPPAPPAGSGPIIDV